MRAPNTILYSLLAASVVTPSLAAPTLKYASHEGRSEQPHALQKRAGTDVLWKFVAAILAGGIGGFVWSASDDATRKVLGMKTSKRSYTSGESNNELGLNQDERNFLLSVLKFKQASEDLESKNDASSRQAFDATSRDLDTIWPKVKNTLPQKLYSTMIPSSPTTIPPLTLSKETRTALSTLDDADRDALAEELSRRILEILPAQPPAGAELVAPAGFSRDDVNVLEALPADRKEVILSQLMKDLLRKEAARGNHSLDRRGPLDKITLASFKNLEFYKASLWEVVKNVGLGAIFSLGIAGVFGALGLAGSGSDGKGAAEPQAEDPSAFSGTVADTPDEPQFKKRELEPENLEYDAQAVDALMQYIQNVYADHPEVFAASDDEEHLLRRSETHLYPRLPIKIPDYVGADIVMAVLASIGFGIGGVSVFKLTESNPWLRKHFPNILGRRSAGEEERQSNEIERRSGASVAIGFGTIAAGLVASLGGTYVYDWLFKDKKEEPSLDALD